MDERQAAYEYIGSELELFANAMHWKSYFRDRIAPYIGRAVLEVGAGLGGTTRVLCRPDHDRWVCLEPDQHLAARLEAAISSHALPACCKAVVGVLPHPLLTPASFDTVLYIDVLEHIEPDANELAKAAGYLAPEGHLVVLSPAHDWLFSPFDTALGHFRRYSKRTLRRLTPPDTMLVRLEYLDSVGLLASLANRMLLKQRMPTGRQIEFWDRRMVPISRRLDPLLGRRIGKSILGVWKKRATMKPIPCKPIRSRRR